jgi:two-component system response regulator RegX3
MNAKPYIYIIEDEESISKLISLYLTKEQMDSKAFFNAEDALRELKNNGRQPNLIILDLNLPGMSGFDFLEEIKKFYQKEMPSVMILSARDTDEDIIKGLGYGADEFVTKPFSPGVLMARIKANLRRQSFAQEKMEDYIQFGNYTLLLGSCVLKRNGQKISLSSKEYEVLEFLVKNAGQVISPERIYQNVWKVEYGDLTAVAVYIQRLRKKIEDNPSDCKYIKTDFGKGYIFSDDAVTHKI